MRKKREFDHDGTYLDYREAQQLTGISRTTLYQLVHAKRIPHIRIGKRFVRFRAAALEAWLASHEVGGEVIQ